MKPGTPSRWSNDRTKVEQLRASSGLLNAVRQIIAPLSGVRDVLVLHRAATISKFFVIMDAASLETIDRVVSAMVQIEDKFEPFDYDTVPADRLPLVPSDATPIGHV